jgi:hypothetical protein
MSASIINIFCPTWASTEARLAVTNDLLTVGLATVIITTLFLAFSMAKCRLVLKLRIASTAESAGLSTANNNLCSWCYLWPIFCWILVLADCFSLNLTCASDTEMVA